MHNMNLIDKITLMCSEKVDKQLFLFDQVLQERESLEFVEEQLYYQVAGLVLMLNPDGTDSSSNPTLLEEDNKDIYESERKVILKYLLTLTQHEVVKRKEEAYRDCVKLLQQTTRTFNKDFLAILNLIVLFDCVEPYTNLCKPLAQFCVSVLYNEHFQMEETNGEAET